MRDQSHATAIDVRVNSAMAILLGVGFGWGCSDTSKETGKEGETPGVCAEPEEVQSRIG